MAVPQGRRNVLDVCWQNQIKISCAAGELPLSFLRAIVANGCVYETFGISKRFSIKL